MATASPPPDDTNPPDPSAVRRERQLRGLAELAEIGLDLARGLRERVGDADPGELALAFSRISRSVRQTYALEERIAEDGLAAVRKAEADRARKAAERRKRIDDNKADVAATMVEAFEAKYLVDHDDDAMDLAYEDLNDWLEQADEDDFAERPIEEIVERICKDLGVPFDPGLWMDMDAAVEEIASRLASSPLAVASTDEAALLQTSPSGGRLYL